MKNEKSRITNIWARKGYTKQITYKTRHITYRSHVPRMQFKIQVAFRASKFNINFRHPNSNKHPLKLSRYVVDLVHRVGR